ncbi:MAG: hypothetical protein JXQ73_02005 [Phycisphaerae bacterium]|nr:hypothetical protein [Phycisphaerae bacterium]
MKAKAFDCVEMKRRGSLRIYEETKDLTFAQKVEYWRRKSEEMTQRHEEARREAGRKP